MSLRNRNAAWKALFCLLFLLGALTACGGEESGTKVVFTTGMGKDEVFRIGASVCTVPEMMVYLASTRNQYEGIYGPEVWGISRDGITLEENVKETVLAKLAQIKAMYLLAQERGIGLEDAEEKRVGQAAEAYLDALTETEKEAMGIHSGILEQLYREYALADKVYQSIIQDVNPEISDDEARTITIQHILFKTDGADSAKKQEIYAKALEVWRLAAEGGSDFLDLASRYSEDSLITYSFGKGEMEAAFEEAAFSLGTGEVSQILETGLGYHIIKCVSTFDRKQTDLNKLAIVEERRREVFGQEYDAFVKELPRQLNGTLWEEMTLRQDGGAAAADFFGIYEKYF